MPIGRAPGPCDPFPRARVSTQDLAAITAAGLTRVATRARAITARTDLENDGDVAREGHLLRRRRTHGAQRIRYRTREGPFLASTPPPRLTRTLIEA